MSELIDRQALKDYVSSLSTHPLNEWDTLGVMAAIDKQPTVAAPRWHRVEDGLPDKYMQCLVSDADGKCAVGYYRYDCEAWDSPAFGWIESEDRIYIDDMPMGIGKVVAWMPIEPPKEDQPDEYDPCYECGGYGDDYRIDEDGELVSNCPDCPFNEREDA